jgi:hypothetical protein
MIGALTLGASVNELGAIFDEIPWDFHELLNLVRHDYGNVIALRYTTSGQVLIRERVSCGLPSWWLWWMALVAFIRIPRREQSG